MPLFHTSGLNIGITMSLLLGVTTVYGSANIVPHAAYADDIHKYGGVDASIGPPSIYEELSHEPKSLERIHNFNYILVCGAAISQTAGDIISKHCRVVSNFGATETACLPRLAPAVEDWAYFYWHPNSLWYRISRGIFSTFPQLEEYSMNDLYSRHPDPAKPFLYKWRGRADDVIVLSNGEKLAPALMEASICSSPLVKGAMVVGRGKFQPAALVDLKDTLPNSAREIGELPRVDFADRTSIAKWIKELVEETAGIQNLGPDAAFFESGLDSLHVIRIVRELKMHAKISGGNNLTPESLSPTVVYSHPSLVELSEFLYKTADLAPEDPDSAYQSADSNEKEAKNLKLTAMESLFQEFVSTLPVEIKPRVTPITNGTTVLLTAVQHIYALDRSAGGAEKYQQAIIARGLSPIDAKRVTFLKADLSDHQLGLGHGNYGKLLDTVTHVLHCQWPVNFNWTLNSFKPYIAGVRNLAHLASSSTNNAFVMFISSIAAVGGYKGVGGVPEAPILDFTAAAPMGYGQSKLIAEALLDKARSNFWRPHCCLSCWYCRWSVEQQKGNVEQARPEFDEATGAISSAPLRSKTYHVVNPQFSSWEEDLGQNLLAAYPKGMVKPVKFEQWVDALKASVNEAERTGNVNVDANPAMRLLEFYSKAAAGGAVEKGARTLPTNVSQAASKTLRTLGPLNKEWLENWMVQWGIQNQQRFRISSWLLN
ncbi:hypothetical protein DID88_008172 [Monilinia fructigena]|uniref:Carrier domain-containing protein n=1 Tax=Monilinia fructigena TaxID=38457 RepID=A0A395J4M2_9HELO|nr:hypothetical protein DID88_008172 [Monilinia fructigena]